MAIILGFIKKSQDNKKLTVKIKDKVTEVSEEDIKVTEKDIEKYKKFVKKSKRMNIQMRKNAKPKESLLRIKTKLIFGVS